jgi:hypothetical protein
LQKILAHSHFNHGRVSFLNTGRAERLIRLSRGSGFNILKNSVSGYVVFWRKGCRISDECDNVYRKRIARRWGKTAALTGTPLPVIATVAIRSEGQRPEGPPI